MVSNTQLQPAQQFNQSHQNNGYEGVPQPIRVKIYPKNIKRMFQNESITLFNILQFCNYNFTSFSPEAIVMVWNRISQERVYWKLPHHNNSLRKFINITNETLRKCNVVQVAMILNNYSKLQIKIDYNEVDFIIEEIAKKLRDGEITLFCDFTFLLNKLNASGHFNRKLIVSIKDKAIELFKDKSIFTDNDIEILLITLANLRTTYHDNEELMHFLEEALLIIKFNGKNISTIAWAFANFECNSDFKNTIGKWIFKGLKEINFFDDHQLTEIVWSVSELGLSDYKLIKLLKNVLQRKLNANNYFNPLDYTNIIVSILKGYNSNSIPISVIDQIREKFKIRLFYSGEQIIRIAYTLAKYTSDHNHLFITDLQHYIIDSLQHDPNFLCAREFSNILKLFEKIGYISYDFITFFTSEIVVRLKNQNFFKAEDLSQIAVSSVTFLGTNNQFFGLFTKSVLNKLSADDSFTCAHLTNIAWSYVLSEKVGKYLSFMSTIIQKIENRYHSETPNEEFHARLLQLTEIINCIPGLPPLFSPRFKKLMIELKQEVIINLPPRSPIHDEIYQTFKTVCERFYPNHVVTKNAIKLGFPLSASLQYSNHEILLHISEPTDYIEGKNELKPLSANILNLLKKINIPVIIIPYFEWKEVDQNVKLQYLKEKLDKVLLSRYLNEGAQVQEIVDGLNSLSIQNSGYQGLQPQGNYPVYMVQLVQGYNITSPQLPMNNLYASLPPGLYGYQQFLNPRENY